MTSELRVNNILTGDGTQTVPTATVVQGSAKAWVYMTSLAATPAISDSHNISSITDGGTGLFTSTMSSSFSSTSFAHVSQAATGSSLFTQESNPTTNRSSGSTRIEVRSDAGTLTDPTAASMLYFGDLA